MELIIYILSLITIAATLLPLHKSKHWFVRGQANFRAVYFACNILLAASVILFVDDVLVSSVLVALLLYSAYVCWRSIAPYTIFSKKSVKTHIGEAEESLSIMIHNVYQYNTKYQQLLDLVSKEDPDILLLLETGVEWDKATKSLSDRYPYVVKEVREDTYGIILMSKIDVLEGGVNHLVSEDIPSVEILFRIGKHDIRVLGIHPEPPVPGEVESSVPKEKEILYSAEYLSKLNNDELHILIGDLNDVAWSKISKKFKAITNMGDPREGRGFYATFPTYSPIRIPLDHVFCSRELTLLDFRRLPHVGSDHHPVFVKFAIPQ